MTTSESTATARDPADVEAVPSPPEASSPFQCVACGMALEEPGCCSFTCVSTARRELEDNVARLRQLQLHDGPAATRTRLVERNGRLTAALMGWRQ
ncbi:hypothetical protein [Egicoccus sp. AB-alg6-2]|uniref:hypothetical protein n=1 Tax=Egicoccus sp. AB-alg6-2 TaxID=3242692 RepID=UPI00359E264D